MARILVVDDERDIRNLLKQVLEHTGYEVETATNGREALEMVDRSLPDLMLLDIMMPEIDGWEVCRQVKSKQKSRGVPIILLTVRNQALDKVVGMEVVGADDYVTKPFDLDELLARVEQQLRLKGKAPAAPGESREG